MKLPADLRYTASHEWIRAEADGALTVGITDHAQSSLGDLVFLLNQETPMGKISNRVRSRLGPFRVVELMPAPPAPASSSSSAARS